MSLKLIRRTSEKRRGKQFDCVFFVVVVVYFNLPKVKKLISTAGSWKLRSRRRKRNLTFRFNTAPFRFLGGSHLSPNKFEKPRKKHGNNFIWATKKRIYEFKVSLFFFLCLPFLSHNEIFFRTQSLYEIDFFPLVFPCLPFQSQAVMNFVFFVETLYDQLIQIGLTNAFRIEALCTEIFEKATTQHNYIQMYSFPSPHHLD